MHHYPFHVGDYILATAHLSETEDLAYRRMLDLYYQTERPLPDDIEFIARRIRMPSGGDAVATVLREFFVKTEAGEWSHRRCDEEIGRYQRISAGGKKGNGIRWGNRPPMPTRGTPESQPRTKNQEPRTKKPIESLSEQQAVSTGKSISPNGERRRATRLPADWVLMKSWGEWALKEKPHWTEVDVRECADRFRDHWIAASGKNATKLDWEATWRNWVRRESNLPKKTRQTPFQTPQQARAAANEDAVSRFLEKHGVHGDIGAPENHTKGGSE